ncbi:tetratricopeptide repeat protein [Chlamydiota bacterium]
MKRKRRKREDKQGLKVAFFANDLLMNVAIIILLVCLGFIVYGNSVSGEFIWDDEFLIKDNVFITSWKYFFKQFRVGITEGAGLQDNYYRPLQGLSYLINFSISAFAVWSYHLTNMLIHCIVSVFVFLLVKTLFQNRFIASVTAFLFVVHPINSEAVSYIAGRADPLCSIFLLSGLLYYCNYLKTDRKLFGFLTCISYILALFSKETALIFPLLLLLIQYILHVNISKKTPLLVIGGISLLYILLRMVLLKNIELTGTVTSTLFQRMPGFFISLIHYLRLLVFPFNLHMEYGNKLFPLTTPLFFIGMLFFVAVIVYGYKTRKKRPITFFCLVWFFITLLPQSNIYPLNAHMAEHWLYLPSISFFLFIALHLYSLKKQVFLNRKYVVFGLVAIILICYSFLTIKQNTYWQSSIAFYKRTLTFVQDSARLHYNLGNEYKKRNIFDKAAQSYEQAIVLKPDYTKAYNNLANMHFSHGRKEVAISLYKKGLSYKPDSLDLLNNLAAVYTSLGSSDETMQKEAIKLYKKIVTLDANYLEAYYNQAIAYNELGNKDEAIRLYQKVIEVNPSYIDAYYNLAGIYFELGKKDTTIRLLEQVLQLNPQHKMALNNLGNLYVAVGTIEKGIALLKKGLMLDENSPVIHYNLAIAYVENKDYDKAIFHCDKAISLGGKIHPKFLEKIDQFRKKDNL